ncbi:hypothetical protein EVAR_21483_1 [Eumeta japonica]|uniref:Uncharacterized protein n=1 Tax=Eumeta variegata TaxID=151549 RepID=A0A4C1UXH1_EUMVA|nr:hypothetical protein EVAR_21483_1 [Eumeta japonica]
MQYNVVGDGTIPSIRQSASHLANFVELPLPTLNINAKLVLEYQRILFVYLHAVDERSTRKSISERLQRLQVDALGDVRGRDSVPALGALNVTDNSRHVLTGLGGSVAAQRHLPNEITGLRGPNESKRASNGKVAPLHPAHLLFIRPSEAGAILVTKGFKARIEARFRVPVDIGRSSVGDANAPVATSECGSRHAGDLLAQSRSENRIIRPQHSDTWESNSGLALGYLQSHGDNAGGAVPAALHPCAAPRAAGPPTLAYNTNDSTIIKSEYVFCCRYGSPGVRATAAAAAARRGGPSHDVHPKLAFKAIFNAFNERLNLCTFVSVFIVKFGPRAEVSPLTAAMLKSETATSTRVTSQRRSRRPRRPHRPACSGYVATL